MPTRLLLPRSQVVGLDGRPISGAKLFTYATGTSTPKAVFTDPALTVAHANPVVADAAGRFPAMFLASGDYRTVLTDAADAVICADDPVEGNNAVSVGDIAQAGLAARRNRIVNPCMQISQERGTAALNVTTGSIYSADQWQISLSTAPGGDLRSTQLAGSNPTPGGSRFRLRHVVDVADAAIAAGDYYVIQQPIEGAMISDAQFGSAEARQLLLRFGVLTSIAGTYSVSIRNSAGTRTWLGSFTVASSEVNTDVVRTLVIPGDETGAWLTDNGIGCWLTFTLAAGTTGVAGWQGGTFLAASGQVNFMATAGATFDLFDVGLYVDRSDLGIFPPFEMPDIGDELLRCLRYYWRPLDVTPLEGNAAGASAKVYHRVLLPVPMRDAPSVPAMFNAGTNAVGSIIGITADGFTIQLEAISSGQFAASWIATAVSARL